MSGKNLKKNEAPSDLTDNMTFGPSERTMPHNIKCEKAVLSAILREPKPCIDIAVENLGANPEVFYSHIHRTIYKAILALQKESSNSNGIDVISLANYLQKNGELEAIGGALFLADLYNEVATSANLESWCKILSSLATIRRLIMVCSDSLQKCYQDDRSVDELIDEIESDVYNIRNSESKSSIVEIVDSIGEEFKLLQAILKKEVEVGISTGYKAIDDLTGGLKKGEMFVLAARPSIGKTAIALNIVRNLALDVNKPRKVAFFSLEMTTSQITRRLLCAEARISETSFWKGTFDNNNITKLTQAVSAYRKSKIFIDETGGLTIAELRAKCRRLKMMEDIDVVVIDYLQLMKGDSRLDNRQQEVANISSGIKQLAKDLNIPVLILAQLNREVDKNATGNTKPKLAHLRESGAIEQDADIVAFLHRDREKAKHLAEHESTPALFIVEKNRNGQIGEIPLLFFPAITRFEVAAPHDLQDGPTHA